MQDPTIQEILSDPTVPSDPEVFERNFQLLFDGLANDVHCWAFIVARFIARGSDEDRLLLHGLLEAYRRNNQEAIAVFSASFSGES